MTARHEAPVASRPRGVTHRRRRTACMASPPHGLPGRRCRRRAQGLRRAATSPWSSTTGPARRGRRVHRQPGQGRAGAVVPAGAAPAAGCARSCSTPAAPTPAPGPQGFQDTHATAEKVAPRCTGAGLGAGEVAVCSTGLIGERLPMDKLLAGVDARGRASSPARRRRRRAADAIMTTDTVPKTAVVHARAAGPSAAWPRAPACSPPAWPPCSCVLTTDAVADAPSARRGAARGHRGHLRPARLRRLHVHQRHRAAAGLRRLRESTPTRPSSTPRSTPSAPTWPRSCWPTPRAPPRRSPSRSPAPPPRTTRVEVGRAVARNNLVKTRALRRRPNWGRVLAAVGTTGAVFEPDRLDVAINGVWICRAGAGAPRTAPRSTCPAATSTSTVDLQRRRRDAADDPDQRPVARRTSTRTRRTRHDRDRSARDRPPLRPRRSVLIEALPWLAPLPRRDRRGQVRRQRDDRRRAQGARSPPTWCSCATSGCSPVVVHGGGPQISAMLDTARHRRRVHGRPAGHHARGDGRRPDGAGRPGRPGPGRPDQRARPARGRHVRRGRAPVHRRPPRRRSSTARRPTSAWSATSSRSTPPPCSTCIAAGRIPVVSTVAPDADGRGAQRQRRHRGRGARGALGRRETGRAHRRRGPLPRLAGPRLAGRRDRRRRAGGAAADAGRRAWCPRWRPACARCRAACRSAHVIDGRVPHSVLLEFSPTKGIGTMVVRARPPHERANRARARPALSSSAGPAR